MSFRAEACLPAERGDHPVILRTGDDDTFVDTLLPESYDHSMATLYVVEHPRHPNGLVDHELDGAVHAKGNVGGLWYLNSQTGIWFSHGTRSDRKEVFYCHMGDGRDFPSTPNCPST